MTRDTVAGIGKSQYPSGSTQSAESVIRFLDIDVPRRAALQVATFITDYPADEA
jgi:hypothetical protein